MDHSNPRVPSVDLDSMFTDRWSPRAFDTQPLTQRQIDSLFEAARWAPSCLNQQPWLFVYATTEADRERFLSALVEGNRIWVRNAPLILYLLCRKAFGHNGQENRHAPFDAGAAWLALALQARKLGLYAHAMAGFSRDKAYDLLNAPAEDYDIMAAIAVGYRAEPDILPEDVAARETPSERQPLERMVREGGF